MPWSHTFFGSLKGRMMLANKKKKLKYIIWKNIVFFNTEDLIYSKPI